MLRNKSFAKIGLIHACLLLGGCESFLTPHDEIWRYSGNAVASNKIAMTIDPWPKASANTSIQTSGEKIADTIDRYKTNKPLQPLQQLAAPAPVTR
ncbi:MAG: hypothetical protein KGL46_05970 [Hyphomicrobiales bacterium]|nr:hypothetical protein [Hyphomicrobiales bacterium]